MESTVAAAVSPTHPSVTGEPSLDRPTEKYLNSLTKIHLQKHCQKLGLKGVWDTKPALINKIMEKSRENFPDTSDIDQSPDHTPPASITLNHLATEITNIYGKLQMKDREMESVKTALQNLSERVTKL